MKKRHCSPPGTRSRLRRVFAGGVAVLAGVATAHTGPAYGVAAPAPRTPPAPHWTPVSAFDPPNGEYGASFVYDSATKDIVLFGGSSQFGLENETWTLSGSTWTDTLATGPPNRYFASMAFDPSLNEMVLFGGEGLSGYLNDTWAWNGTKWTELSPTNNPPGRFEASMAYDAATHDLVLFGGSGACGISCSDTWLFNGTTWTQAIDPSDTHGCPSTCPDSPPALFWGSMAYDPGTKNIVLFGGEDSTAKDVAGTWTWNGSVWTDRGADPSSKTSVPAGLYETAMAYDARSGNLVLFGGAGVGGYESTTSVWNGASWTQAIDPRDADSCPVTCPASPPGRVAGGLAYDPESGDVVLFGGQDGGGTRIDTWFWALPPRKATGTKLHSSATSVARGDAVTYTAATSPNPDGGTVKFSDGTSAVSGCAAKHVEVSSGIATCRVTYHRAGVHKIRASYSGTSAFDGSASLVLTERVTAFASAKRIAISIKPPTKTTAGHRFTLGVSVVDAWRNVVTSDRSSRVRVALEAGTGTAGTTLRCSSDPVTVRSGVAVFHCSINKPGTGYRLFANSAGLTGVRTGGIEIT